MRMAERPLGANIMTANKKKFGDLSIWNQFHDCDNKLFRVGKFAPPKGIDVHIGSQWSILSADFMKYVIQHSPFHKQFYQYMSRTEIPDESYFQTLIMASPFCKT